MARLELGEVRVSEGALITAAAPEDPSIVTRRLAEQGIYLRGLTIRRATLEEAFLRAHAAGAAAMRTELTKLRYLPTPRWTGRWSLRRSCPWAPPC